MSLHLGSNPVDLDFAYRAAIESSLDVVSSINECVENSRDYSKVITVTFFGDPIPGKPGVLNLSSVEIDDDGIGMDFAVLYEKFRGAFFNSVSHDRSDQSGRNGVGVKTNLQYWNEIKVSTTTNGLIPSKEFWQCADRNRDEIDQIYRKVSKLKPGDRDTELRIMSLMADGAELHDFEKVSSDDSWTRVTLLSPRSPIELNIEEFIRRQSHCIEWLSTQGHVLTVGYKNEQGKKVTKAVRPFYEHDKKDSFICHVQGNSKEDMHIHYQDHNGTQQSKVILADKSPVLGSIDLDIKILDRDADSTSPNEFIISICGANVYDANRRKTAIASTVEFILGKHNFPSARGFSSRIHGYVKTDDERLKRALRHNKSVLDEDDKYAKAFIEYIVEVLKPLNVLYVESLSMLTGREQEEVLDMISVEFNSIMKRVSERATQKKSPRSKDDKDPPQVRNKEYCCNACGLAWKVPLEKTAVYCAEHNMSGIKGCGSRDIDRNTHARNDIGMTNVNFEWTKNLGGFLPARYEPTENKIWLAQNHPSFITTLEGLTRIKNYKCTVGLEKSFIAVAAHRAQADGKSFDTAYGEILREWFESKSARDKHKVLVHKTWKDEGLTIDLI